MLVKHLCVAAAVGGWVALAPVGGTVGSCQNAPQGEPKAETKTTGKVGEKIPAFTGKVTRGEQTADFDSTKNAKTTVYMLVGVTCPATGPYVDRMRALERAYSPKGVDFVFLYVNVPEPLEKKLKFHRDNKLGGAFLNDEGGTISKKLAAKKTGEALIVDKDGKVVYRGGIDDHRDDPAKVKAKHVANALDEILAGKAVSKPSNSDVFG